jgi:hypothetical protein
MNMLVVLKHRFLHLAHVRSKTLCQSHDDPNYFILFRQLSTVLDSVLWLLHVIVVFDLAFDFGGGARYIKVIQRRSQI